jgi:hypothetical protein
MAVQNSVYVSMVIRDIETYTVKEYKQQNMHAVNRQMISSVQDSGPSK